MLIELKSCETSPTVSHRNIFKTGLNCEDDGKAPKLHLNLIPTNDSEDFIDDNSKQNFGNGSTGDSPFFPDHKSLSSQCSSENIKDFTPKMAWVSVKKVETAVSSFNDQETDKSTMYGSSSTAEKSIKTQKNDIIKRPKQKCATAVENQSHSGYIKIKFDKKYLEEVKASPKKCAIKRVKKILTEE